MPSLVEIGPVFWRNKISNSVNVFFSSGELIKLNKFVRFLMNVFKINILIYFS